MAEYFIEVIEKSGGSEKRILVPHSSAAAPLSTLFQTPLPDPPEVPATPTEQDIVDALIALGLVTQAEA